MTAVTDTSPICYLILIGKVDVLRGRLHQAAPASIRAWAADLPSWISVVDEPPSTRTGMEKLQAGEQHAILLAEALEADMVLVRGHGGFALPGGSAS